MTNSPAGYLLDVPYIPQFHREHAPVWLRASMAALGQPGLDPAGSGSRPLNWCELGCGPGVGLLILAATNPDVHFHGIDINPEHIAEARRLAEAAGIGNVTFHCADLCEVADLPADGPSAGLPDFDFVLVRGLYSWVSPEVRLAVRRFVGRHLTPGGVALLHYMALPGAADFTAFHGLFTALQRQSGAGALAAVQRGRDLVAALRRGGAGFFATHPVAEQQAAQIATHDAAYTAHDFLNPFYVPFTVTEVMGDMAGVGLALAGSADPLDNLDDFSVPESLRAVLRAEADAGVRELIRDFAGNRTMRLDLYRRPGAPLTPDRHFAALRKLRFRALPGAPAGGGVTFETRIGPVQGHASIFSPVLEAFASRGAVSYAELERLPVMAGRPGLVNQTLHALMGGGAIHPLPDQPPDAETARRLNAILLRRHAEGAIVPALAAPQIGSGLTVPTALLDRLASGEKPPADWAGLLA